MSIGFVTSCTPVNTAPMVGQLTESDVRAFADPMTENMLQAINTFDYAQYTRDFDDSVKKNLSQDAFETVTTQRIGAVGNYVSKEYWQMVQKDDKLTVAYRAKFGGDSSNVTVTVYFKNINGKWYIDGTYYDSPLLRASGC